MPCFPGHLTARLIHQGAWNYWNAADGTGFFDHFGENEKKGISEKAFLFVSKNFRWKSTFHLIYHRNNRFFHTKGKRPRFQSILFHATNLDVVCLVKREPYYFEKRKASHFIFWSSNWRYDLTKSNFPDWLQAWNIKNKKFICTTRK